MGQAQSRRADDQSQSEPQRRRRWSTAFRPETYRADSNQSQQSDQSQPSASSTTMSRPSPRSRSPSRRTSRLLRARSSLSNTIPQLLARRRQHASSAHSLSLPEQPSDESQGVASALARLTTPMSVDESNNINNDETPSATNDDEQTLDHATTEPTHPTRSPRSASPLERLREMIPRHTLRRRRSRPMRAEDQTAILTDLLSAAAAATAASILGDSANSSARTLVGDENGAFESFLQALRNGNIASALRSGSPASAPQPSGDQPQDLNFFRMFRFGATESSASSTAGTSGSSGTTAGNQQASGGDSGNSEGGNDGRMVPIIIVGIRSINPGSQQPSSMPPFLDSLINTNPTNSASPSIDGLLSPSTSRTNAAFSHRRRTSTNSVRGLRPTNTRSDTNDLSALSELRRRYSATSDYPTSPLPPPGTPASAGISAFSSGTSTPVNAMHPSSVPPSAVSSRRGSLTARRTTSSLETTTASSAAATSAAAEPLVRQRLPRTRRFSEDWTGSSRRNGMIGPSSESTTDENAGEPHRSWIIYVLGGSYPENHPLLATPSLFTDNPQYEDMLLLASLLGPAKPPVASEADLARASGLFIIRRSNGEKRILQAAEVVDVLEGNEAQTPEIVLLANDERCLVCLADYEEGETVRQLKQCRHLFHRECIDQWLLTGRNSCPLCRTEGVERKEVPASSTTNEAMDLDNTTAPTASGNATDVN